MPNAENAGSVRQRTSTAPEMASPAEVARRNLNRPVSGTKVACRPESGTN